MRLYSYIVARDFGFAPNPFYRRCTLTTCKPQIRKKACVGDWVIGTGSNKRGRRGYLVYAMQVNQIMTLEEYWQDLIYQAKRPKLYGSWKQAYGDNIYRRDSQGEWRQLDSHHSLPNGALNEKNVRRDTQVNRMLVGKRFAYFGGSGPQIPTEFRDFDGVDICAVRGHKCNFSCELVSRFVEWFMSLNKQGFCGKPSDWE